MHIQINLVAQLLYKRHILMRLEDKDIYINGICNKAK